MPPYVCVAVCMVLAVVCVYRKRPQYFVHMLSVRKLNETVTICAIRANKTSTSIVHSENQRIIYYAQSEFHT